MPRSGLTALSPPTDDDQSALMFGLTRVKTLTLENGRNEVFPTRDPYFVKVNSGQVELEKPLGGHFESQPTISGSGHFFVATGCSVLLDRSNSQNASISFVALDVSVLLRLLDPAADIAMSKLLSDQPANQGSEAAVLGAFELLLSFEENNTFDCFSRLPFIEDFHRSLLAYRPVGLPSVAIKHQMPHPGIHRLVCQLHADYPDRLSVSDMSKTAGMSRSSLFEVFKKETGHTPTQYLRMLRLAEAQRLLAFSSYQVAQAAYSVGYKSTSQFCRDYHNAFDHPPSSAMKIITDILKKRHGTKRSNSVSSEPTVTA